MIKQNLAIYSIPILFDILKELEDELNYNILNISSVSDLKKNMKMVDLVLTKKNNLQFESKIEITFPIKILKLIEKINVQFIRYKTKEKASILIKNFKIDLNQRSIELNSKKVSLTEKEVNMIIYLNNSIKPVNIQKLQTEVWGYKSKLNSHTVETHIHRLRKKIYSKLNENNFILSDKNGYFLNK